MKAHNHLINHLRESAILFNDTAADYLHLLEMIDDARFVLIGEATHGTEEFYRVRAELTKWLIAYRGFTGVAVEGDWPDCYRINRYVRGDSSIRDAESALTGFTRFPAWMWRNQAVTDFIDWLADYNQTKGRFQDQCGFYGLDLYSLHASIEAVIAYLEKVDPHEAARARAYYGCFDCYDAGDPEHYGYACRFGASPTCEQEVIDQLVHLRHHAEAYLKEDGANVAEAYFCAEQNAKTIVDAEHYYRSMFHSHVSSWNLRDRHMMETLNAITVFLSNQQESDAKIVVWAHNSHIGDARATEREVCEEWNLGQLVREQHGTHATRLIGFSTYAGTVTAASKWGENARCRTVQPALKESYEALFHEVGYPGFALNLRDNERLADHLHFSRLQRAIGVLYLPETERESHYFFATLPKQFDMVIHIDETHALKA